MKIVSKEDVIEQRDLALNEINKLFDKTLDDDESRKQTSEYFKWLALKTKLISNERDFQYPPSVIPSKIDEYVYNYLYSDKRAIIDKYYKHEKDEKRYILNAKKSAVSSEDREVLANSCIFRRGKVVWVEFGYNVGREFGGRHPALILKNCGKSLIVLPLSSKTPSEAQNKFNVGINKIYNFVCKDCKSWGNVQRITMISVQRVDFDSAVGSVDNALLHEIGKIIEKYGIK